jgi:hypothetical protein
MIIPEREKMGMDCAGESGAGSRGDAGGESRSDGVCLAVAAGCVARVGGAPSRRRLGRAGWRARSAAG